MCATCESDCATHNHSRTTCYTISMTQFALCCRVCATCRSGCATCIVVVFAATHCNTLQHTATRCNTLQHNATNHIVVAFAATHCNTLQNTVTHCIVVKFAAAHCNTLNYTASSSHLSVCLQLVSTVDVSTPFHRCLQYIATHCNNRPVSLSPINVSLSSKHQSLSSHLSLEQIFPSRLCTQHTQDMFISLLLFKTQEQRSGEKRDMSFDTFMTFSSRLCCQHRCMPKKEIFCFCCQHTGPAQIKTAEFMRF